MLLFTPQPSTTASSATPAPAVTGTAPRYDAFAKDLPLGPDGEVIFGNPWEALADETLMGALVTRGRYPEFDPSFGCRFDLDARQPTRSLQQAAFQNDLQTQIMRDPAVKSVGPFTFTWTSGDTLSIAFTITPVVGPTIPVSVPWSAAP